MIDLWVGIGLVVSHFFAGATPVVIYKTLKSSKVGDNEIPLMPNETVRMIPVSKPDNMITVLSGFDVEGTEDQSKVTIMNDQQYLNHLCKLYPEAYNTYKEKLAYKRIIGRSDRYVMRMIIAAENGDLDVELGSATINFSNGDQVWIANKYYAYGYLYHSKHNSHCIFDISNATLSLYTFMRLVHLEETFFDPVLRLKHSTVKVVSPNA